MGGNNGSGLGSCLCFLVVAAVAGTLTWYFTLGGGHLPGRLNKALNNALNFVPSVSQFQKESPYNETSPKLVPRWPHSGYGLSLEIVNALDATLW
jgi:hypothetical protein